MDGKPVLLDGFVFADGSAASEINRFQFVYNVAECCFKGPPQVQERVFATVPNGGAITDPGQRRFVRLAGTLHVKVVRDDAGNVSSVYTISVSGIEPL